MAKPSCNLLHRPQLKLTHWRIAMRFDEDLWKKIDLLLLQDDDDDDSSSDDDDECDYFEVTGY